MELKGSHKVPIAAYSRIHPVKVDQELLQHAHAVPHVGSSVYSSQNSLRVLIVSFNSSNVAGIRRTAFAPRA